MLLLLSHFSHVQLCATPETAAHQAPPSLGFFRQEHWSGLPFPSPIHESEKWKWSRSVMSDSLRPHGLQPTLGYIYYAYSNRSLNLNNFMRNNNRIDYFSMFLPHLYEVRRQKSLLLLLLSRFSHVQLCATPETAAHQAPPSLGFSR